MRALEAFSRPDSISSAVRELLSCVEKNAQSTRRHLHGHRGDDHRRTMRRSRTVSLRVVSGAGRVGDGLAGRPCSAAARASAMRRASHSREAEWCP
jgi:hypothetical protein